MPVRVESSTRSPSGERSATDNLVNESMAQTALPATSSAQRSSDTEDGNAEGFAGVAAHFGLAASTMQIPIHPDEVVQASGEMPLTPTEMDVTPDGLTISPTHGVRPESSQLHEATRNDDSEKSGLGSGEERDPGRLDLTIFSDEDYHMLLKEAKEILKIVPELYEAAWEATATVVSEQTLRLRDTAC